MTTTKKNKKTAKSSVKKYVSGNDADKNQESLYILDADAEKSLIVTEARFELERQAGQQLINALRTGVDMESALDVIYKNLVEDMLKLDKLVVEEQI